MSLTRPHSYLVGLVRELQKLPRECEWVEFKENKAEPEEIGEYIAALANSAALFGKAAAFVVWGVKDEDRSLVGTRFDPISTKVGNEELESWLLRLLSPKLNFRFNEVDMDGRRVVVLEIERASRQPVRFRDQEFVRVGSYKKKLKEYPEKERQLWRFFDNTPFEARAARENVSVEEAFELLDVHSYFELLGAPIPETRKGTLEALEAEGLVRQNQAGGWDITNLGALLFASSLDAFPFLKRKAVRIVVYTSDHRLEGEREEILNKGYASGFEQLIGLVNALLPKSEVIERALRRSAPMYPELAIRELIPNALIHQDLSIPGAGPMVDIFPNRLEITNPGAPLVDIARLLDMPPRSRNEALASLMRRIGVCEERGSGIDKVVFQTELYQLPPPLFEVAGDATRAVLFAPRGLDQMDSSERIRACYLHACLRFVARDYLTNTSLRERFKIENQNKARASRLIREAVEAGAIAPHDPGAAPKLMKYVPWWAKEAAHEPQP